MDCQNGSDVGRSGDDCQGSDDDDCGGIAQGCGYVIGCGSANDGRNGIVCPTNANGSAYVVCKVMDSESGSSVLDRETKVVRQL
jgi:hypothetical protein